MEKQKQVMRKEQIRIDVTEREKTHVKVDQDETAPCGARKHLIIAQIVRAAVSAWRRKRRKPGLMIQARERAALELDMLREST